MFNADNGNCVNCAGRKLTTGVVGTDVLKPQGRRVNGKERQNHEHPEFPL